MSIVPDIQYLVREDIDTHKWDNCITAAPNGLIYAYSWYLDALCDHWDALVLGDYDIMMPLPWRSKWGIRYVYTPFFVQQLGVIGSVSSETEALFVEAMHRSFRYGVYHFNFNNGTGNKVRTNFVLPLHKLYGKLTIAYTSNLRRNLQKAQNHSLIYSDDPNYPDAIKLYQQLYAAQMKGPKENDFDKVGAFCSRQPQHWTVRMVRNTKGMVLSSALLLCAKERMYLLMPATTPEGRKLSAGHFLIDQLIREFAGKDLILDFEGSDLPGVHGFYKNFGGQNQPYFLYRWNHLPAPIRWIKK
jgi:hypothetical protein